MRKDHVRYESKGIFDAREWFKEGDGLLVSARTTRATWLWKKRAFTRQIKKPIHPSRAARRWDELEGLPRASVLLLGYAVEMYLKGGVARAYHQCPEALLQRDLRRRFGHDLRALAQEVEFVPGVEDQDLLGQLSDFIRNGARYPITPRAGISYTDEWNKRTGDVWNAARFRQYCSLAARIKAHVERIDWDSSDPATFRQIRIDRDGYVIFRLGGRLRPRVTYRASTEMALARKTAPEKIKAIVQSVGDPIILHYWDAAVIIEDADVDGRRETIRHTTSESD
jgi:hypothetical protein